MSKYTQVRETTPKELQLNAGILLKSFDPSNPEVDRASIFAATSGGVTFTDAITFVDLFEDVDNMPKNTKEGKQIDSREVTMAGTVLTITPESAKAMMAAADIDKNDPTHIIPRDNLLDEDFEDFWWVGDYSDKTGETKGGFCAIHIMNALSTGGFSLQTGDKAKGQFAMTYTAHYSIEDIKKVPYEMFIKQGEDETAQGEDAQSEE